jgi:nucleotide-binding universal stress UspA family protein
MATHGRAGLPAVWGGSVAAHLLGHLRVPVLLIRNVEDE